MPDDFYENKPTVLAAPLAISHIVRTLRTYLPVIALSIGAVMVGYLILAIAIYVLSPSQAVTSLRFRIDFKGADLGEYPNGTKFSAAEIITAPVLLKVYEANDLGRFTTFADFTKAIFVLESNTAHDTLSLEYQSRMSDPKLMPVDRDRLQREYESKLASLSKDQYSVNYLRPGKIRSVPEAVARKVLHDILREWADFVTKEQHVLEYRVALLSPSAIGTQLDAGYDPIVATQMLRGHVMRISGNIQALRAIPAADLVHTKKEGLALVDLGTRLEDILRYQLDPLVQAIAGSNLITNRASTIHFLEAQLAYDERALEGYNEEVDAARQALALYMSGRGMGSPTETRTAPASPDRGPSGAPTEVLMPQLSESFLERVIQMTTNTADVTYRKTLTENYRLAAREVIPMQHAVAYDRAVLEVVKSAATGTSAITREAVNQQLMATRDEVRRIVVQVHEIHAAVSRNMNPSTQLITLIGVPATRLERSVGIKKLALYGILICFITLPIIVILCLLHNRVREEEAAEASIAPTAVVESTG
jgi:hypothetical protein